MVGNICRIMEQVLEMAVCLHCTECLSVKRLAGIHHLAGVRTFEVGDFKVAGITVLNPREEFALRRLCDRLL